ncbi:claudin-10-like [Conger conger]|uniref:claudin-10-like n=1 Tax=Conger conger TaxID=82655 RepID=UPI002A5AF411|nr:claudin-10-like [Conger conger]
MKESFCLTGTLEAIWARMNIRVVQIFGFLFTVLGWIFVACTMAMEYWKITTIGGLGGSNIIKVAWYWSSLWRACFTDSTAVTNCIDFPVLWSVEGYVQAVRGLLMIGLSVGMLGFVLCLTGMECTYIGGKDKHKNRTALTGALCHIIGAMSSFAAYVVYAYHVSDEYLNRFFGDQKYDLGTPLFLGWVGAMFEMTGGVFYCVSVHKLLSQKKPAETENDAESKETEAASKAGSEAGSKSKLYEKSAPDAKPKSVKSRLSSESALSSESSISSKSDLSSRSEESGRGSESSSSSSSGGSTVGSLSSGSRSGRRSANKNSYV